MTHAGISTVLANGFLRSSELVIQTLTIMYIVCCGNHATDESTLVHIHVGCKTKGGLHLAITALLNVIARFFILLILAI